MKRDKVVLKLSLTREDVDRLFPFAVLSRDCEKPIYPKEFFGDNKPK